MSQSMLVNRGSECGMCKQLGVAIDEFRFSAQTELVMKTPATVFAQAYHDWPET